MRTTLTLDDDAMESVHAYARDAFVPFGKAASELIRRGAAYQLGVKKVHGLPVFEVPTDFPKITTAKVQELLEE